MGQEKSSFYKFHSYVVRAAYNNIWGRKKKKRKETTAETRHWISNRILLWGKRSTRIYKNMKKLFTLLSNISSQLLRWTRVSVKTNESPVCLRSPPETLRYMNAVQQQRFFVCFIFPFLLLLFLSLVLLVNKAQLGGREGTRIARIIKHSKSSVTWWGVRPSRRCCSRSFRTTERTGRSDASCRNTRSRAWRHLLRYPLERKKKEKRGQSIQTVEPVGKIGERFFV